VKVYPVNLLLENKKCLIIGGGKVAARKVDNLLEAGTEITVIANEICSHIRNYAQSGLIKLLERDFEFSDLDEAFLVYIATSDRALNLNIAAESSKRKLLFCLVDRNWNQSDFITPAVVRRDNITVSVSTGGIACRKSRLIKDNIARHIEMIEQTELLVIGTDFHHLSNEKRSPFHLNGEAFYCAADKIMTLSGVHEFIVLNTCNRIEIILTVAVSKPLLEMLKMILGFNKLSDDEFYIYEGYDAFEHLSLTAAGIFSQTPGENHITAQFKEAFRLAANHNYAGYLMQNLHDSVMHTAKDLRTNLISDYSVVEIEELADAFIKNYIEKHLNSKKKFKILILGTGKMGQALMSILAQKSYEITWCYHSRKPELDFKENISIELKPIKDIKSLIQNSDIVLSALSSDKTVLTYDMCCNISHKLLMIDLGIPPNIDVNIKSIPLMSLINLGDLKDNSHSNIEKLLIEPGRKMVATHRNIYEKFKNSFINGHQR
jgi:precorrin-2 dehydrogenase/sirohydrochlorin ferrochelatase